MRIVSLDGAHHLCCGNGNHGLTEVLGGPSVLAGTIGHYDLCLLKFVDIVGFRLEIMRIDIG